MQNDVWLNTGSKADYEKLSDLQSAADSWLKQLSFHHHDFTFIAHSNMESGFIVNSFTASAIILVMFYLVFSKKLKLIWQGEIQWAAESAKGKSAHDMIYRMAFAGSIYFIWIERTKGYFKVRRGQVFGWQGEIQWSAVYAKGKSAHDMIYRMAFAGSIDFIWIERNRRLFQGKKRTEESIARQVIQEIFSRGVKMNKAARGLEKYNFYP
ncbi:hypothetical protein HAX54_041018 [Datura stramonium]|uniref:Uncharacterized protein n=1 Tax=Datura stramonium TaxID=4076 RepID=A0ABS8VTG8_DATST|nr:hypothetical protein [Datura stramonium]